MQRLGVGSGPVEMQETLHRSCDTGAERLGSRLLLQTARALSTPVVPQSSQKATRSNIYMRRCNYRPPAPPVVLGSPDASRRPGRRIGGLRPSPGPSRPASASSRAGGLPASEMRPRGWAEIVSVMPPGGGRNPASRSGWPGRTRWRAQDESQPLAAGPDAADLVEDRADAAGH